MRSNWLNYFRHSAIIVLYYLYFDGVATRHSENAYNNNNNVFPWKLKNNISSFAETADAFWVYFYRFSFLANLRRP